MSQCDRPNCSRPAEHYLCWDCVKSLRKLLLDIVDLAEDLEIQATRQSVGEKSPGGSNSETPLMFDEHASDAARVIRDTLGPYAPHPGTETSGWDIYRVITWMARRLSDEVLLLAKSEIAAEVYNEIDHAHKVAVKAVTPRPGLLWLGDCDCGRPVYGAAHKRLAVCSCGSAFSIQDTRDKLRELGRDYQVTARQAEALGEFEGKKFKRSTIRVWVNRGKIDSVGDDPETGEHLYRFGDLLDQL
ncbi:MULTISPECIES: hypothetical protein [Nocardia]|uniref:hypothetical protein n=1 Tax=Nocardia TaxID=1817 RepID=UPI0007A3D829|nr:MULTISPECIES: hypothetical protein [Nocardia]